MPPTSISAYWADFLYLAYRTLVIVCSMLVVGIFIKADSKRPSPDSVTEQFFTQQTLDPAEHRALVEKVVPRLRMLRAVKERLPITFTPYKTEPSYRLTYFVEKLACGHERISFPQAESAAKRRYCGVCAIAATLPEKKPAGSVSAAVSEQEQKA